MAVPSETTATRFGLAVQSYTLAGSRAISFTAWATPGVYARHRSSFVLRGFGSVTATLPPLWNVSTSSRPNFDMDPVPFLHSSTA